VTGLFILDTGASTSCMDLASAHAFNLISEETEIKAASAGAINMETLVAKGNNILLSNILVKNVDFVLFDMVHVIDALVQSEEEAVDGILGADILKRLKAVIDYGRNCFYIKA